MSLPPSQNVVTPGAPFVIKKGPEKKEAYLFGPFIGSLEWELYRFAPHAIYLKKCKPKSKLIVLTRPDRFDLYGQYASIFVPLKMLGDDKSKQNCFKVDDFSLGKYMREATLFEKNFCDKYEIVEHFYPDIGGFRYKLKWQFPRHLMDYEFNPRLTNKVLVSRTKLKAPIFVDSSWIEDGGKRDLILTDLLRSEYNFVDYRAVVERLNPNLEVSLLGCIIIMLKKSKLTVGNLNSPISHLSILLGTPLVSISDNLSKDAVSLLNPLDVKVIQCEDALQGIEKCEYVLT